MVLHFPEGAPKMGGLRAKVSLDGKEKGRSGTVDFLVNLKGI